MRILFVHQNFPGQFPHLAPALVARGHEVMALTDAANKHKTALRTMRYAFQPPKADFASHGLAATYYQMTERGRSAARASVTLRDRHGFSPDVIMGNLGWGETLFLKEVWPKARLLIYAEFFYRPSGYDVGFDPEFGGDDLAQRLRVVARQAHLLQAMVPADAALAPTRFQAHSFPDFLHDRITVIHDGVDTTRLRPNPAATFDLPDGRVLRAGDEVLTFVNRNLEPYRGYHIFMRALPEVLGARPDAQVVLVGGDGPGYGPRPPEGRSWKDKFLSEMAGRIDMSRVHFTGRIGHDRFVALMQVSRVHAYLTYPFVLSWSLMEAMAAGAHVVGSRTPPVQEVIRDGDNGRLVDFFDVTAWSRALIEGLADPDRFAPLRTRARETMVEEYDLSTRCLPRLVDLVETAGR
jgi:glycosyltransferase involved in cell wall biosynthesis